MQIIADLHIHSKYSRAVSSRMDLPRIGLWSSVKGINLVSTGDFTHPAWFREIATLLKETAPGIYELKRPDPDQKRQVRFILTVEISSIYSQGGRTRRIHHIVFAPDLETAGKLNKQLSRRGANLVSDGRPITGIASRDLLEIVMTVDSRCLLIPAHIWTPWYSLFGSKSGFNSLDECFGETGARSIYGIETGLSSDPVMNWQIKELESRSIISSSDAHSGPKLGREATVFIPTDAPVTNYAYDDIAGAIRQRADSRLEIGYTIEFFPEEGKYHWTGHRRCGVRYSPAQEKEKGIVCPVCGKPLTVGVDSRVTGLAGRHLHRKDLLMEKDAAGVTFVSDKEKKRKPFVSIIPLQEVLTELENGSIVRGERAYRKMTAALGSEFDILLKVPYHTIESYGGPRLRQAIQFVRGRRIHVDPGYDGVFGAVRLFKNETTTPAD